MIRVRRVEDVAVVDWTQKDVAALVPRLRSLVEAREAPHALLNMSDVDTLKGDGLETLTEALSVCEDGACVLGMFGLNTYVAKFLEIMGLENVMPTVLGATEAEALVRVRSLRPSARGRSVPAGVSRGSGSDLGLAEVEIEFEPQDTSNQAPTPVPATPAASRDEVVLEFDMDAPPEKAGGKPAPAPGANPGAAAAPGKPPSLAATMRFDKAAVGAIHDEPEDMLAIAWADLVSQGIPIGGPGARDLAARSGGDAGAAPEADRGAPKPTTRFPQAAQPAATAELEIDLEPAPKRAFKTEVISTFEMSPEESGSPATAEKSTRAPASGDVIFRGDETRTDHAAVEAPELEVDFEPVRSEEVGFGPDTMGLHVGQLPQSDTLFGESEPDASGWSPVDTETEVRRPAALDATAPPADRTQTPPRPMPARPVTPAQPVRPQPTPAQPAARAPTPPQPTPLARPGVRPAVSPPTPVPAAPAVSQAPPPHVAPAPPAPVPAAAPPAPAAAGYYGGDAGDETVMFQPDGFLAEVLAAVSPNAQPEAAAPGGRAGETSLDLEIKTPLPAAAAPAPAAPTPAPAAAAAAPADARDDLRRFLVDYAVVSELHLRVLERFSREGVDKILGRPDVQAAVGGSAAAVASIIEDYVQARLLKRRRSPRVRGGTGFLYSPSPRTRNAVTRLLRLYEDGQTRAEVLGWVHSAKQAAGV